MRMPRTLPQDCVFERCLFIVDTSASTSARMSGRSFAGTRLETSGEMICRFTKRKREMEREDPALTGAVGIISFSETARVVLELTLVGEAEPRVRRAVRSMKPESNTDFCAGLDLAREVLQQDHPAKNYPDVGFIDRAVFLSDSGHNCGGDPARLTRDMKKDGILIFTIGVSDEIDTEGKMLLEKMASVVDGERWYRHVTSCDELIDCFAGLAGHITR
jgi:Mg-chelatase subunit ChlD